MIHNIQKIYTGGCIAQTNTIFVAGFDRCLHTSELKHPFILAFTSATRRESYCRTNLVHILGVVHMMFYMWI